MISSVSQYFLPRSVVLVRFKGSQEEALISLAPFIKEQTALQDEATAYLCTNHVCQFPLKDLNAFREKLKSFSSPKN